MCWFLSWSIDCTFKLEIEGHSVFRDKGDSKVFRHYQSVKVVWIFNSKLYNFTAALCTLTDLVKQQTLPGSLVQAVRQRSCMVA